MRAKIKKTFFLEKKNTYLNNYLFLLLVNYSCPHFPPK